MTTRPITEDDLQAFVDGALDATRVREVEAYLALHEDEAARIASYRSHRLDLRSMLTPIGGEPVPPELNLVRLLADRRRRTLHWWQATAAVLLIGLGGAGGWLARSASIPPAGGIAALTQEATATYATFEPDRAHPVEIRSADADTLGRWLSDRLGRRIALPDLTASGYRMMGGRIVATPHGPAGMLMYDDDHGSRVVMLTRPMESDRNASPVATAVGGLTGISWADDGLGFSVIGGTSAARLQSLAESIRDQAKRNS